MLFKTLVDIKIEDLLNSLMYSLKLKSFNDLNDCSSGCKGTK